jgi:hypothetical protein
MTEKTTVYMFDVLGKLWMPTCYAAKTRRITAGGFDDPETRVVNGEGRMTDESARDYPRSSDFGDFSSIVDCTITRVDTWKTWKTAPNGDGRLIVRTRVKVLCSMSEENECHFSDCFGSED